MRRCPNSFKFKASASRPESKLFFLGPFFHMGSLMVASGHLRSPCLLTYTGLVHLQNPELVVARSAAEFSGAFPSNTPSYLSKTLVKDRCLWAVQVAFAVCGQKT